jgi:hypothetical protein
MLRYKAGVTRIIGRFYKSITECCSGLSRCLRCLFVLTSLHRKCWVRQASRSRCRRMPLALDLLPPSAYTGRTALDSRATFAPPARVGQMAPECGVWTRPTRFPMAVLAPVPPDARRRTGQAPLERRPPPVAFPPLRVPALGPRAKAIRSPAGRLFSFPHVLLTSRSASDR